MELIVLPVTPPGEYNVKAFFRNLSLPFIISQLYLTDSNVKTQCLKAQRYSSPKKYNSTENVRPSKMVGLFFLLLFFLTRTYLEKCTNVSSAVNGCRQNESPKTSQ